MPIAFAPMLARRPRKESIFVSASIPDPAEWDGEFDALEITDAVVAAARAFLTAGFRLVTAAHPTIAPLMLYVAAEFPSEETDRVVIYQSRFFADDLPAATQRFEEERVGHIIWTPEATKDPTRARAESLALMRGQMLHETDPIAACFIGGMEGIEDEHRLFTEMFPGRPTYPVGRPGGEARGLVQERDTPLTRRLATDNTYPALWRAVVGELEAIQ